MQYYIDNLLLLLLIFPVYIICTYIIWNADAAHKWGINCTTWWWWSLLLVPLANNLFLVSIIVLCQFFFLSSSQSSFPYLLFVPSIINCCCCPMSTTEREYNDPFVRQKAYIINRRRYMSLSIFFYFFFYLNRLSNCLLAYSYITYSSVHIYIYCKAGYRLQQFRPFVSTYMYYTLQSSAILYTSQKIVGERYPLCRVVSLVFSSHDDTI